MPPFKRTFESLGKGVTIDRGCGPTESSTLVPVALIINRSSPRKVERVTRGADKSREASWKRGGCARRIDLRSRSSISLLRRRFGLSLFREIVTPLCYTVIAIEKFPLRSLELASFSPSGSLRDSFSLISSPLRSASPHLNSTFTAILSSYLAKGINMLAKEKELSRIERCPAPGRAEREKIIVRSCDIFYRKNSIHLFFLFAIILRS
jgi:hypothetical protein